MRVVAGTLRGRALAAPTGSGTRPTADRVRQALFDMLAHAPWAEGALDGPMLDAFCGSGALAIEGLSRGAPRAVLMDRDRAAVACTEANLAACRVAERALVLRCDATRPPPARPGWGMAATVFLDPPYRQDLVLPAARALAAAGWAAADALFVAELAADEAAPAGIDPVAERGHGAARLYIWRGAPGPAQMA